MAELSTLARPYAKAAFEYALAGNTLDQWSSMLGTLAEVLAQPPVAALMASPALTLQAQAQRIIEICGDSLDNQGQNLVHLLAENRRLQLIPAIRAQFEQLKAQRQKTVDVTVTSAHPLDEGQQEKLSQALSQKLDRAVNMTVAIDQSLIGGVVVRAGDTIIDGSLRGRLSKLAEALNS
jgi:F-type H+-transporting ATPase subunit delta